MALTEDQKKKIISELSIANKFDTNYSETNRQWFVRHMIEYYSSAGIADTEIKERVRIFTDQCKIITKAKQKFKIGVTFTPKSLRLDLTRKIEIIYGLLAVTPELTDAANNNFFDYIIKRRYRCVTRMEYFVNPNSRGYFMYPKSCPTATAFQTNINTINFWRPYDVYPPILKKGKFFRTDFDFTTFPVGGINHLFSEFKNDPCLGNLLDCARVLCVLLMDALLESADSEKLLKYFLSKADYTQHLPAVGPMPEWDINIEYLSICHPTGDPENSQFIRDKSGEGLYFSYNVPAGDLQVGDHVYIFNHPLYKVFNPLGSWRGEHALVYQLNNRDYKTNKGIKFGGHGMEGTLYKFYSKFLQELKTDLERTFKVALIHLLYRQTGPVTDGTNFLGSGSNSVKVVTTTTGIRLFEYSAPITYHDYENKGKKLSQNQFVIGHGSGSPYEFWIDKEVSIDKVIATGVQTDPIILRRRTAPPAGATSKEEYAPELYSIVYHNEEDLTDRLYDLFEHVGPKIGFRQIKIADLFIDPLAVVPGTSAIITTQPRADVSLSYLSFLKAQGAIT